MSKTLELVRGVMAPRDTDIQHPKQEREIIAIAVPSGDSVNANFCMSLAQMLFRLGLLNLRVALINCKGSNIAVNRNSAVKRALELGCSKLLFIDSDMTFPMNGLERLIAHDKPIVGATYGGRNYPHKNNAIPKGGVRQDNVPTSGIVEVDALPTGFLLINLHVFAEFKQPFFRFDFDEEKQWIVGEDYNFCARARAAGFSVWCDMGLSLELVHWGEAGFQLDAQLNGRAQDQPDARIVQLANS